VEVDNQTGSYEVRVAPCFEGEDEEDDDVE
jgi:hypothetical protein